MQGCWGLRVFLHGRVWMGCCLIGVSAAILSSPRWAESVKSWLVLAAGAHCVVGRGGRSGVGSPSLAAGRGMFRPAPRLRLTWSVWSRKHEAPANVYHFRAVLSKMISGGMRLGRSTNTLDLTGKPTKYHLQQGGDDTSCGLLKLPSKLVQL